MEKVKLSLWKYYASYQKSNLKRGTVEFEVIPADSRPKAHAISGVTVITITALYYVLLSYGFIITL